ncbi:3-isopropylmalate dehydrogenase [Clostridium oceanicum]|uniref:3-isopropylmalate dehydrogenase n=1 Tax=Clostridium oceanicum TaxID=1543 RepID=A0ABN1J8W3_9CLOT
MKIAVLPGDGIGREIINEAIKVLDKVALKYKLKFEFNEGLIGGCAVDEKGRPFPKETLEICKNSDAVLLGAVGGPKWDKNPSNMRPEKGLLELRKSLGVFSNLRPAILFSDLKEASNLKEEVIKDGLDIMIVRELISGAYFGEKKRIDTKDGEKALDTIEYSSYEIERITKRAFEIARKRNKKLTLIDKANVLETSKLWRKIVSKISLDYKDVKLDYMYVDNAAMQLIKDPNQFDVILTENMFGDILSDEASMLTGSLGMLPSASLGKDNAGIYEPIHGSAPDIAGEDKANPIGTIMSVAMMLKYSFGMEKEARDIEKAVETVLNKGYRTSDIYKEGKKLVGTEKMGTLISEEI